MKIHAKKKAYKLEMKKAAKAGLINDASGRMIKRESGGDSMVRNYSPQR
jgi:hypothetical protein